MYMYLYKDHVGVKGYEMREMEDVEVVMKRFGDEQSTLLDRFERLSFEVQLNQAILGRSFSEPRVPRHQLSPQPPPEPTVAQGRRPHYHHRGLGFQKVLKKLLRPIFGKKKAEINIPDQKNFKFMKAFSRSLKF